MLYKGKVPKFTRDNSNMRKVLKLLEQGYQDRAEIANLAQLTKEQVTSAMWNLVTAGLIEVHRHRFTAPGRGRMTSIYRIRGTQLIEEERRPMANISFIFWAANKDGKGSK